MKNIPKQYLMIGIGVLIILLGVGGYIINRNRSQEKPKTQTTQESEEEKPLPTVDPSVKVSLKPLTSKSILMISVESVPDGTESIDYELSYNTVKQGFQGVIGTIEVEKGSDSAEKRVELGTCSSGACIYHDVDGPVSLSLKFVGSYGEQVYENEFNLDE